MAQPPTSPAVTSILFIPTLILVITEISHIPIIPSIVFILLLLLQDALTESEFRAEGRSFPLPSQAVFISPSYRQVSILHTGRVFISTWPRF